MKMFNSLNWLDCFLNAAHFLGGPSTPRSTAEYFPEDQSTSRQPQYAQPVNPPNPADTRPGPGSRSTRSASQSHGSSSSSVESLASSSSREVSSSFESNFPQDIQVSLIISVENKGISSLYSNGWVIN